MKQPDEYHIFILLAIIILLGKILESVSRKLRIPPVIGLIILGIFLGPSVLNFAESGEVIKWLAKFGVLFLLFEAGLETDLKKIKADSKMAFYPAIGGIILPFFLGMGLTYYFFHDMIKSLIAGTILTATSVSISVVTLMDMKKIATLEGRTIVNAAIIDDIVGILLLTFVFGFAEGGGKSSSMSFLIPLIKIVIFFIVIFLIGHFIIRNLFQNLRRFYLEEAFLTISIGFIFLYSWLAEHSGVAAITGAYFAGLFLGQTGFNEKIKQGVSTLGKSFFIDLFFVNIGLEFNILGIQASPSYLILFLIVAIIGKVVGCGIGARMVNFDTVRSLRIGSGMIPRGEVGLIIANMAVQKQLISDNVFSATILMVVVTAIITPVLLKYTFLKQGKTTF